MEAVGSPTTVTSSHEAAEGASLSSSTAPTTTTTTTTAATISSPSHPLGAPDLPDETEPETAGAGTATATAATAALTAATANSTTPPPAPASATPSVTSPVKPKRVPAHIARTHTLCSVVYFGSVKVDAPSSAVEINRNVLRMRQHPPPTTMEGVLCIPRLSGGFIHLLHAHTREVQMSVPVKHIVYCARSARVPDCLGFTSNYHEPRLVVAPLYETGGSGGSGGKAESSGGAGATGGDAQKNEQPTSAAASPPSETGPGEMSETSGSVAAAPSSAASSLSSLPSPSSSSTAAPASSLPAPASTATHAADPATPSSIRAATPTTTPASSEQSASSTDAAGAQGKRADGSPPQTAADKGKRPAGDARTSAEIKQRNEQAWHLYKDSSFYCHVFQFQSSLKAEHALHCIAHAFGRINVGDDGKTADPYKYRFEMSVGISEDDTKSVNPFVPMAKDVFKLRLDHPRRIHVTVAQTSAQHAIIERSFGVLVPDETSNTTPQAMLPLTVVSTTVHESKSLSIVCDWEPPSLLKSETPKDQSITIPIGIDLVLLGVNEPVRLVREIKVRVCSPRERFWSYGKRDCVPRTFEVQLAARQQSPSQSEFHVASILCLEPTEKDTYLSRLNKMLGKIAEEVRASFPEEEAPPDLPVSEPSASDAEDEEFVVVSGSGTVEREVVGSVLDEWGEALRNWDTAAHKSVVALVRRGVPDTLRHQVWLRLAGGLDTDLTETFPFLLTKEPNTDEEKSYLKVIKWDLTRTFPAHDFFKDPDGEGQRRLYNLCRAYSVYDDEIGYCQGLSFIAAVLLLHMPEEEAFTTFVKIMYDFGVRELFKPGFDALHLKLFQLNRLMEEHVPDVHAYFTQLGVVPHMYASQWFLTLFVAKFSLPMVYHILDVFLSEGLPFLFQVALAFIKLSRKELLGRSFEEIQQFFRVVLPRTYTTDAQAEQVVKAAVAIKISSKKLQQYEQEYYVQKAQEADDNEDPQKKIASLREEAKSLKDQTERLEREAENMAQDLLNQRSAMQQQMDQLEQEKLQLMQANSDLNGAMARMRVEAEEDKARLATEAQQVKEMYRRAMADADAQQQKLKAEKEAAAKAHELEIASLRHNEERMQQQLLHLQARADLVDEGSDLVQLQTRLYETELALAAAKLQLAEADSKNQHLEQQVHHWKEHEAKSGGGGKSSSAFSTWFRRKPQPQPPPHSTSTAAAAAGHDKPASPVPHHPPVNTAVTGGALAEQRDGSTGSSPEGKASAVVAAAATAAAAAVAGSTLPALATPSAPGSSAASTTSTSGSPGS